MTAAKRVRQKANRMAKKEKLAAQEQESKLVGWVDEVNLFNESDTSESEAAAAKTVLPDLRKLRERLRKNG